MTTYVHTPDGPIEYANHLFSVKDGALVVETEVQRNAGFSHHTDRVLLDIYAPGEWHRVECILED